MEESSPHTQNDDELVSLRRTSIQKLLDYRANGTTTESAWRRLVHPDAKISQPFVLYPPKAVVKNVSETGGRKVVVGLSDVAHDAGSLSQLLRKGRPCS